MPVALASAVGYCGVSTPVLAQVSRLIWLSAFPATWESDVASGPVWKTRGRGDVVVGKGCRRGQETVVRRGQLGLECQQNGHAGYFIIWGVREAPGHEIAGHAVDR